MWNTREEIPDRNEWLILGVRNLRACDVTVHKTLRSSHVNKAVHARREFPLLHGGTTKGVENCVSRFMENHSEI